MPETYTSIGEWALKTFGFGRTTSCYLKLGEEFGELARPIQKQDTAKATKEMADMVIVLCHMAASMGVDLGQAIEDKMAVNRARTWEITPEGTGVHVVPTREATKQQDLTYNESDTLP